MGSLTILHAVILGIVQGIGEFLPISSSAHLIFIPWVFGWNMDVGQLTFDVALHFGTLIAVLLFFWKDWFVLAKEGLTFKKTGEGRMFWYLVAATIPGALIGKLLENQAETTFRNPQIMPILISLTLAVMGIILYLSDKYGSKGTEYEKMSFKQTFLIGLSQALAIIPGVSRAGITMSSARALGVTREAAARFSFLLSAPIVFGATIFKVKDLTAADFTVPFIVGILTSAIVGFISIKFLLKYLKTSNFNIFVIYRIGMAALLLSLYFIRM